MHLSRVWRQTRLADTHNYREGANQILGLTPRAALMPYRFRGPVEAVGGALLRFCAFSADNKLHSSAAPASVWSAMDRGDN